MKPPIIQRTMFAANGCLEFDGYRNEHNYGIVRRRGQKFLAHRWSWIEAHGEIPDDLCVLHRCDNPPCINPEHLFLGTFADNNRDRNAKGRSAALRGLNSPNAKFTAEQIREIRRLYDRGLANQYELAATYGVSQSTIGGIVNRIRYRSVA